MPRPGIVRADTLDLQDHDSPHIQDRRLSASLTDFDDDKLVGPHQAAEVRQVVRERQIEERNLQNVWQQPGHDQQYAHDGAYEQDAYDDESAGQEGGAVDADDDLLAGRASSSPSIEDEDIDFDFVYALHTFIATVEGQANATKGDTMVLLDDSNSYWWLVRVVKDGSIGYLPAEHIETPTERLARLNKHRNVDLCAVMLNDNVPEKSKLPAKKQKKKRVKAVQFSSPTYVEPSDYEATSDDDDISPEDIMHGLGQASQQNIQDAHNEADVAGMTTQNAVADVEQVEQRASSPTLQFEEDQGPPSPRQEDKDEALPIKTSRKGTPRNAESFLKDDSVEPHKMSLTPQWLNRNDTPDGISSGLDNGSQDSLDKLSPTDKSKGGDKKKKEKKPGMLSGLFKKKDKKDDKGRKRDENDAASINSAENRKSPHPSEAVERKGSKKSKFGKNKSDRGVEDDSATTSPSTAELEGSQVAHEAPTGREDQIRADAVQSKQSVTSNDWKDGDRSISTRPGIISVADPADSLSPTFMHGTEVEHIPTPTSAEFRQDNVDSQATPLSGDQNDDQGYDEQSAVTESTPTSSLDHAYDVSSGEVSPTMTRDAPQNESILDHPYDVSSREVSPTTTRDVLRDSEVSDEDEAATPLASAEGTGYNDPRTAEDDSSVTPSARNVGKSPDISFLSPQRQDSKSSTATASTTSRNATSPSPVSTNETTWSDTGLRAWLDGDNDVHDMLVVIHDNSDVKPVGNDHPLMAGLFAEETQSLQKLSDQLDGMLNSLLSSKRSGPVAMAATS